MTRLRRLGKSIGAVSVLGTAEGMETCTSLRTISCHNPTRTHRSDHSSATIMTSTCCRCDERDFNVYRFSGAVAKYPFQDHNAPQFEQIISLCEDAAAFLRQDPNNIVAINCKAGKVSLCRSYLLCTLNHWEFLRIVKWLILSGGDIRMKYRIDELVRIHTMSTEQISRLFVCIYKINVRQLLLLISIFTYELSTGIVENYWFWNVG